MQVNQQQTALDSLGINALNDMQQAALAAIPEHNNTIILAPTGSGKTLAFLLPVLQLMDADTPGVQCLILSPTRELAIQIERVWQKMQTGLKVNTCYGGHLMQTEIQNLSQPPALLIGTPGRIQEHITRGSVDLSKVLTLVLDEFDKSLSMGFQEQMADILKSLTGLKKRILVSATNKLDIPDFTGMSNPKTLDFTATENTTEGLTVKSVMAVNGNKLDALFHLLCFLGAESTLIFCNFRESTTQVVAMLKEKGIESAAYHGGMEQLDREKALVRFRNGSTQFLVTSDLAARGLDIPAVKNVIHYETPQKHTDYLHRNGRTARMHAEGVAWLILSPEEPIRTYLTEMPEQLRIPKDAVLPEPSPWTTLYISGGKKDKLSKMDIVGFFSKKGNLGKDDLGLIEVMDFMSFAAVKKDKVHHLLAAVQMEKMKGKKYKIVVDG
ncbi:MAG: DEAD/DEAH box helicase [Lewinellaceae bacterium]|nr:DEAD/DEAH box helicase [Lewinellaceae bacterium]